MRAPKDAGKKKPKAPPSASGRKRHDYAALFARAKNRKALRKTKLAAKLERLRAARKAGKLTPRQTRRLPLQNKPKAPTAPSVPDEHA